MARTDAGRPRWVREALGVAVLIGVVVVLGATLRGEISRLSAQLLEASGQAGLWMGSFMLGSSPIPMPLEPLMLVAHAGGLDWWETWLTIASAAVLAGPFCYAAGRILGQVQRIRTWLDRAGLLSLMERRGAAMIALAAVTPLPFATLAWTAGASRCSFPPFAAACLLRSIKVAATLTLVVAGWSWF